MGLLFLRLFEEEEEDPEPDPDPGRLLFLRDPPPTGMLRRAPPLVQ